MFSKNFNQYVKKSLGMFSYGILSASCLESCIDVRNIINSEQEFPNHLYKQLHRSFNLFSLGLSIGALSSAIE